MTASLLALALAATAPSPKVALTYARGPGAEQCPDESALQAAVAAQLGFNPFAHDGTLLVDARIESAKPGLKALVTTQSGGQPLGKRELSSEAGDCSELANAVALAIAIAIDPELLVRPRPAPTPPAPAPAPEAPGLPVHWYGAVGAHVSAGLSAQPVAGGSAEVAFRRGAFGLGLEGRADLASTTFVGTGRVTTSVLLGSLVPCAHFSALGVCAPFTAGALQLTGELGTNARRESGFLALAGGRLQLDLPPRTRLSLRPYLEVQASLTRITVFSGPQPLWVTAPVAGRIGLAGSIRFTE